MGKADHRQQGPGIGFVEPTVWTRHTHWSITAVINIFPPHRLQFVCAIVGSLR